MLTRPRVRAGPASDRSIGAGDPGFTLIEMIVVIAIMSALLGIGVGSYLAMGRGLSAEAQLSKMEDALRSSRNFAIRTGSRARVDIDTESRTFTPLGFKVIGLWHLEDAEGAFDRDLVVEKAEQTKGKIGEGLLFEGKGSYAFCDEPGDLHKQDGVCVEAWVFPMLSGQDQYIFRKPKDFDLKLTRYGTLSCGRKDTRLDAEDYWLPLYRWAKVAVLIDSDRMQIYVDDILRAEADGGLDLPKGSEAFQISDANEPFVGIVDEVRFLGLARGRAFALPEQYTLVAGVDSVCFDRNGGLDPVHHGGELTLGFSDGKKLRTMTIGRTGLVRERKIESVKPPAQEAPKGGGGDDGGPE